MNPEITAVDVATDGKATITMQKHLGVRVLQDTIGKDSQYKILEADSGHDSGRMIAEETQSWVTVYKPLLVIGVYVTGVASLAAHGSLHAGMTYFMAGFFLVFSFFKFLDLKAFASSYSQYDLLAIKVPAYGFVYPFIELALGLAFATGFMPIAANWTTLIVMGFSSLGVIRSVLSKQKIRCACLGAVFNLPMSTVTIIEDLVMAAMAGYMLVVL